MFAVLTFSSKTQPYFGSLDSFYSPRSLCCHNYLEKIIYTYVDIT